MNKLFTKIATAFVGMAMAIGVGVAIGSKSDSKSVEPVRAASAQWQLVTSAPSDWSGEYILGNGTSGTIKIMDGSSFSSSSCAGIDATVTSSKITADTADAIIIAKSSTSGKYTVKLNGKYIGKNANSNGIDASDTWSSSLDNEITYSSSKVVIKGNGGRVLTWYAQNSNFRYYASSNNNSQLYKKVEQTYTVNFAVNTAGYGTVSRSSITGVPSGTAITTSNNQITINGTTVTATPTAASAQYTYAFTGWTNNTGTVTAARTITANFSRTTNTFTVGGTINNGSLSSTSNIEYNGDLDVSIVPASGYTYPTSISVTMGGSPIEALYDDSDGTIYFTPVTGNIVINATCPAAGNIYSITTTVTNGTYSGDTTITDNGGVASVTIAPTGDYKLPASVSVSGADHTYNDSTGVISLSNATGNVTISAAMVALTEYSITVNETNGSHTGASTIKESRTASLTFEPDSGYGQPASVTVTGATYTWTKGTGVLSLSNPTGNVSVTYSAAENELTSITLSATSGNYTLGDAFVKPTVTAHYSAAANANVTSSATYSGYDPYTTGNQAVTISYTEGGITKTASYTANVSAKSVGYSYNKISSVSDIDEGDYIIAYSTNGFDNRDANNGYTTVAISNDSIAQSAAMDKLAVHITPVSGGYTLQVSATSDDNAGKYINYTTGGGSNTLKFEDSAQTIPISLVSSSSFATHASGGAFAIGSTDNVLAWNDNSGNYRYRFYKVATTTDDQSSSKPGLKYFAPDLYKKVSSGSAELIRITASYTGGDKYVGDTIYTTDFTVQKQLDTGTTLTNVTGFTINGESSYVLASTSNNITVSYTEGGVTKTATVVVSATEREASLEHVVLNVGENAKLDGYVYWSGAEWDLTDITVTYDWDDDDFDETVDLQDLVDSGDATLSPATPTLGATSFTVSYSYLEKNIENATVTLDEAVVADYVSSVSWSGKSLANFKAFSGQELTASTVNSWTVKATYAGAGETNALSFGTGANQFTIRIGDSKAVTSLPYTWTTADDNQFVYVVVGGVAEGDSTYAKTNICATINAIDHSETHTGEIEKSVTWSKDDSIAAYGTTSLCDDGVALDENIFMQGAQGDAGTEIRFWSDGIRTYTGGNTLTFTPSNGAIITKITLPTVTVTSDSTSSASSPYTITDGDSAVVFNIGSKSTIGSDIVVEYTIEGSETTTVHYANDMNHFDAQKKVVEFAKFMNTTMNGSNVCSGTFTNLESAWDDVAGKYNELFGAGTSLSETELAWAKNMLKYATAAWGSEAEAACVEKAMRTYEFVVQNHKLTAFMSDIRPVQANRIGLLSTSLSDTNNISIIVIISLVSVAAVGGYFFLRKRKENN